jgi:hypothetical protein
MMNAVLCSAQVSLVRVSGLPSILSPTTQHPPAVALTHTHQRVGLAAVRFRLIRPSACTTAGSGLHPRGAGSPGCQAESSSLSYGLLVIPPVLPTPPHGDAVAFSSRPEYAYLERTCTSDQTRSQTVHPHRLVRWVNEADRLTVKAHE